MRCMYRGIKVVDDSKQGMVEHKDKPSSVEKEFEVKVQEIEDKARDEDIYVECVDVTSVELLKDLVMIIECLISNTSHVHHIM